jgi:hypothetical protein
VIDPRIILELGASVPVFREGAGLYEIDPPGQFHGAVRKTEIGYESYRYPSKTGEPIGKDETLLEAILCFMQRKRVERSPSRILSKTVLRRKPISAVWCGSTNKCECGERKFEWGHEELRDLITGEVISATKDRVR